MLTPEAVEKANRALKVFRGLQPTLSSYARMLTGRPDVLVVAATESNGATDGKKIFYRPPIALGDVKPHEKWHCHKREESGKQKCPACADREMVLATVYHEIAHIWFESFAETTDYERKRVLDLAIKERGGKYADAIKKRIDSAPYYMKTSYMGLAKLVSDFLPLIINALEDARVNRELFRAMPGTVPMFSAKTVRIFEEGVEQMNLATGEWDSKPWKEYPLNMQAICGLFCLASGYKYDQWFHPDVVAALEDEQLRALVKKTGLMSSMSDIYGLAFPVLARLRELGYCRLPEDPEDETPPPPPPAPPQDSEEEPDEEEQQGEGGDSTDNEEPGEQDKAEPDSGGSDGDADESSPDDSDGDESTPGGSGQDQQGEDDSPGRDDSGETDDDNEADEASSEAANGTPGESEEGESGVDGDDGGEGDAEGSPQDGEEAQGDAGSPGEGGNLDGAGQGAGPGQQFDGLPPSDEVLEEDVHDPGEGGDGSPDPQAGDDPELDGEEGTPDSNHPSPGDGDGDLGGRPGVDSPEGEPAGAEDFDPAGRTDEGERGDEGEDPDPEGSEEPIDTGPFSHGTTVHLLDEDEPEPEPRPEMGTPEECEQGLIKLGDHEPPHDIDGTLVDEEEAIKAVIVQGMYFETPSAKINGVLEFEFPDELYLRLPHECPGIRENTGRGWHYGGVLEDSYIERGIGGDFSTPESVIGPALVKARVAFADNLRGKNSVNHRSGKVSSRHLGKRAPVDDDRMMRRKTRPARKSYFVLIGIDISGSTRGKNILLAKQLAMAEAELLSRLGIKFAIIAHSGNFVQKMERIDIHLYHVKKADQPWDEKARTRLAKLGPDSINLDGHTIEMYRKILDGRRETDRILHYYTDGAMPAANAGEELAVMQREFPIFRKRGYILTGIGIRTDSPRQHGLDTIELHEQADILKVIRDLEKRITGR